jgi:trimethylamine--corrinoid protein Co-methyltransferase
MTLSLEHMIIDNEIAQLCKRIKDGVDVAPEKNYFEDIKEVGQGGHFLKQRSTRSAFRSDEFYRPTLSDRNSYDEWERLGSKDMMTQATERVVNILSTEPKNPLSRDSTKILDEIMQEVLVKFGEE